MIIDAIVVHYNHPAALERTVGHLLNGSLQPRRVLVVDNASASGPPTFTDERVRVVSSGLNGGYGYAVNVGFEALLDDRPDAVLVLTHETVVDGDCLARLAETFDRCGPRCLVGPLLADGRSGGRVVWSAGGRSTATGRPRHYLAGVPVASVVPEAVDVEWLDGAALMMSMETWAAAGGLDEGYFLYQEDVDLSRRVRANDGRIVCDRQARASQAPGNRTNFQALRNGYYFHRRWSSPATRLAWVADEMARTLVRRPRTLGDAMAGLRSGVHWHRQAAALAHDGRRPGRWGRRG